MPEIAEAQALLAALAETDEVKAEAAQRQRLTQLHVAYGNALIAARGYGAPETTEAFAKARESASGDKDAPERLAADYGLWVGSYARGDVAIDAGARRGLPQRRRGETRFARGRRRPSRRRDRLAGSPASIARRGIIWNARSPCSNPAATTTWPFALDMTPASARWPYLAIALWPLGEVDRAISLIDRMQTRIADLTHVGTLANRKNACAALFELMRGDHARATSNAFELARLAREHDLPVWRAFGDVSRGLGDGGGASSRRGLEDMRRGVEQLREQNVLIFDGLIEDRAGRGRSPGGRSRPRRRDPRRSAGDGGPPGLSRVRSRTASGARRNPARARPRQSRSCGRGFPDRHRRRESSKARAASNCARRCRSRNSTNRPTAPSKPTPSSRTALEGFSPTPEMPEIAEAQALLAALMATDEVKAAVAQRERRLHLQTAYGQAMMWSKGFASEETKAAFDRAAELTANSDDFSHRFAALHGQWTLALVRRRAEGGARAGIGFPEGSGEPGACHRSRRSPSRPRIDVLLRRQFY